MKGVERAIKKLSQAVNVAQEARAQGNGARNALGVRRDDDIRHAVLGMIVAEGGIVHDADLSVSREIIVRLDPRTAAAERKQKAEQEAFDRAHEAQRIRSLPFISHEVSILDRKLGEYRDAERNGNPVTDPDTGRGVKPSTLIPRVKAAINDLLSRLKPEDRAAFEANR